MKSKIEIRFSWFRSLKMFGFIGSWEGRGGGRGVRQRMRYANKFTLQPPYIFMFQYWVQTSQKIIIMMKPNNYTFLCGEPRRMAKQCFSRISLEMPTFFLHSLRTANVMRYTLKLKTIANESYFSSTTI